MARIGFCGPTYQSVSPNIDAERCINLIPEVVEAPNAKSKMALLGTPGLKLFSTIPEGSVPLMFSQNGRAFVIGANLYELFPDGSKFTLGSLAAGPYSVAGSQVQLLIAAGGNLTTLDLVSNVLTPVDMSQLGGPASVSSVAFMDGYFVAGRSNTQGIQLSNLLDGQTWSSLNSGLVSIFPDIVTTMLVDHRELWVWGRKASTVYYNTGAAFFQIAPIPGVYLEQGSGAPQAAVKVDNSVLWLSYNDDRGGLVAYRAQGYAPARISNHAVENFWKSYPQTSNAIGYAYEDAGHAFWVILFPSANAGNGATWVYDTATNMWHERGFWAGNTYQGHLSQCHMFAFGKHLVGDPNTGNIYEMSTSYYDDNGSPLRRMRRSPHVSIEDEWIRFHSLQIAMETGLGPQPPLLDGNGNPREPMGSLRWSKDGGHNWGNYQDRGLGFSGDYKRRAVWRRMGRARNMAFEFVFSDPVPCRIVDAYLKAGQTYTPEERMSNKLEKMS